MTTTLKPGDAFPENVKFSYIPYQPENESVTACGILQPYDASKGKFNNNNIHLEIRPVPFCHPLHLRAVFC